MAYLMSILLGATFVCEPPATLFPAARILKAENCVKVTIFEDGFEQS